ncbi:phosphoribosyltransferase family protein [Belliella aquatica]|nr:phosphoribosyltransferase family protein [Belliella aquatica]MCH7407313.1 phosphoribosyl transferase [Belliella aquatica]
MNDLIKLKFDIIPKEIDLIVGVPRSGILPATLLSLYCHKPFASLNEFLGGLSPLGGERIGSYSSQVKKSKNVLVVDDSINTGNALRICKQQLKNIEADFNFFYCTIYSTGESKHKVDFFFEILENPRIFEWNLTRSWIYANSCVDIDGVLCEDPTEEQNDDGEKYKDFILNAVPKYLPKVKIKYLVTSRLEKYREETQTWLKKHQIEFEELFMLNLPSKEKRQELNCHGKFKAEVYLKKRYSSILFIESSKRQSKEINQITKLPVFCTDSMEFYDSFKEEDIIRFKIRGILSKIKRKMFG